MKVIYILLAVIFSCGIILAIWNYTHSQPIVTSPVPAGMVGQRFILSGKIPSSWIAGPGFGIELTTKEHGFIGSEVIFTKRPSWWNNLIIVQFPFYKVIDMTGITAETPTCFGDAILVIQGLYEKKNKSYSISFACDPTL